MSVVTAKAADIALTLHNSRLPTMAIALTALLFLIVLVGTLWILHHQRENTRYRSTPHRASRHGPVKSATNPATARKEGNEWVLEIESPGCEAAHALVGRKFTREEAPKLPVAGCKATTCTCHYRYLPEQRNYHRRTHSDRRANIRFNKGTPDRRSRKNRRHGNWDDRSF